jgi:hypothetical protein
MILPAYLRFSHFLLHFGHVRLASNTEQSFVDDLFRSMRYGIDLCGKRPIAGVVLDNLVEGILVEDVYRLVEP